MNIESGNPSPSGAPRDGGGGDDWLPDSFVLVILAVIALACVGGYFLLMKLIDISRQEDCFLAGRRNCAPTIQAPSDR